MPINPFYCEEACTVVTECPYKFDCPCEDTAERLAEGAREAKSVFRAEEVARLKAENAELKESLCSTVIVLKRERDSLIRAAEDFSKRWEQVSQEARELRATLEALQSDARRMAALERWKADEENGLILESSVSATGENRVYLSYAGESGVSYGLTVAEAIDAALAAEEAEKGTEDAQAGR